MYLKDEHFCIYNFLYEANWKLFGQLYKCEISRFHAASMNEGR
jgi:hypothetical protein